MTNEKGIRMNTISRRVSFMGARGREKQSGRGDSVDCARLRKKLPTHKMCCTILAKKGKHGDETEEKD